jgi:hypothetical protein
MRKYFFYTGLLLCATVLAKAQSGKTPIQPLPFADISVQGEMGVRALRNYDRLETDIYTPEKVFPARHTGASEGWPGDYEGRIMLALTLQAQATHREPRYLPAMIAMLPEKLNSKGYLGPVQTDSISEQQLSGHGWLLRALCEYYTWKKDPAVKKYISDIITNLVLPTRGYHKLYPIDPAARVKQAGGAAGTTQNSIGRWQLSSDIGCDFIFMDGVVHAYTLFPSPELKAVIDEMVARFLQMDVVAINAQTHATLTGLRALLRYYNITHQRALLDAVVQRYSLYRRQAMTANYENFNWFERPEWTEPCAIVDAFMVATQLWQFTQTPQYLQDAHLIYYNAIGHTQRANGGFGLDNCPGPVQNTLSVVADEAYWCCTMRGGEGMASAIRYNYFTGPGRLILPFFNSGNATMRWGKQYADINQESKYPFEGEILLTVGDASINDIVQLELFAPDWAQRVSVTVNGKPVAVAYKKGFAVIRSRLTTGMRIRYSFGMQAKVEQMTTYWHARKDYYSIRFGPLLLSSRENREVSFRDNPDIDRISGQVWQVKETGLQLTPVYHLLDPAVQKEGGYMRQVLFHIGQ